MQISVEHALWALQDGNRYLYIIGAAGLALIAAFALTGFYMLKRTGKFAKEIAVSNSGTFWRKARRQLNDHEPGTHP